MASPHTAIPQTETLSPPLPALLREFKQALQTLYREQLVGLVLFGSHARQTATPDSDIDLLVVLQDPISPGDEILRMGDLKTDLNLKYDALISVVPISQSNFAQRQSPLLQAIRQEGVAL
jgi:predicted nucleotidyltransferase